MKASLVRVIALVILPGFANAAEFIGLGYLPGNYSASVATDVSANGSVVVGYSTSYSGSSQAFRWTASGGMVGLGVPVGVLGNYARAVSADGSVVVGSTDLNSSLYYSPFRWTASGGMGQLGPPNQHDWWASDVSADGSAVVGTIEGYGYRWTTSGAAQFLGPFSSSPWGDTQSANAVSADGSVVVGSTVYGQAYRWTAGSGAVALADVPGGSFRAGVANDVSADGSVVVGVGKGTSASGGEAYRWTAGGGFMALGDLPGGSFGSSASDVSADGSVVVGTGTSASGVEAFVWTQAGGMQRLFDVLVTNGAVGLEGWQDIRIGGISADGQWVVGEGRNSLGQTEGFLANITAVPVPPAVWLFGSALGVMGVMRRKLSS